MKKIGKLFVVFVYMFLMISIGAIRSYGWGKGKSSQGTNASEQTVKSIAEKISKNPILQCGEWSVFVMDVQSGKTIVDINGDKSVIPASNLKLFTTAAALSHFGPEHRFKTKLGYTGQCKNGTLQGDLVLVGGGDPTLGSTQVPENLCMEDVLNQWVESVQKHAISKITGDLLIDVSYFDPITTPDGWLWMDIGNYYGAGPSALCFHDNLYYLYFKPAKKVGEKAEILFTRPEIKGLTFQNYMKTGPVGSGDHGYIYGGPGKMTRILHGTVPAGVERFSIKGSIPDPELFCGQTLQDRLQETGIQILGEVKPTYKPVQLQTKLLTIQSPPLRDIVYWINKKSINLYTEVLLKQLGKVQYGKGSFDKGIRAIKDFISNMDIPLKGMHLFDGSGLSPYNTITTRQMALLLREIAQKDQVFVDFYDSLPIAGIDSDDGHLSHLCRGTAAANNLRAKTGLIERVRAHSGYVNTRSGRLLCFSMIANDFLGSWRRIDRLHEKLMTEMASLK